MQVLSPLYVERIYNATYWDTWQLRLSQTRWKSHNNLITLDDEPFRVRGVSFNGIESECRCPLGLFTKPLSFFTTLLQSNGVNAVRLPLAWEVMANLSLPIGDCVGAEPLFRAGMPVGDMLELLLDHLHTKGIYALLDLHTIGGRITEYPWTDLVSEDQVILAWLNLMQRFHRHPAVMGAEIKNEPHGDQSMEGFLLHCTKVIRNIEHYLPAYEGLYFIAGVQNGGRPWGGAYEKSALASSFRGFRHPNSLCTVDTGVDRLVLCPHVYGCDVRGEKVGAEGPAQWQADYGFVKDMDTHWRDNSIVPTEFGGYMKAGSCDRDYYERWLEWHRGDRNLTAGGFFWTLGPFSQDTGGILDENYQVDWFKLNFLKRLSGD